MVTRAVSVWSGSEALKINMIYSKWVIANSLQNEDNTLLEKQLPEEGSPHGVVAKVLNCSLEGSEFGLQPCYYIHFRKGMNSFILPAIG